MRQRRPFLGYEWGSYNESCIQVAVYDDGTGEEVRSKFGKESK